MGAKISPGQPQFLHPQTSYAALVSYTTYHFLKARFYAKHLTNNNSGVAFNMHLIYTNLIIFAQKAIN